MPAFSVLSTVEGLEVSAPGLTRFVLPISTAVIIVPFAVQWRGTAAIGRFFGPVMVVWFLGIGLLGLVGIAHQPSVLVALSPLHGLWFCVEHGWIAFIVLGPAVLAVTGAEALYADMGHFGRAGSSSPYSAASR